MVSRSCAIKIGSENMDKINNVLFNNCIIKNSNRGIGIQNRDEGTVTNVIFSNMIVDCMFFSDVWWGKAEPIYVTSYPRAVGNHKDARLAFPEGSYRRTLRRGEPYLLHKYQMHQRERHLCRWGYTRQSESYLL